MSARHTLPKQTPHACCLSQNFYASAIRDELHRKGDTGAYANIFDIVSNLGFIFNPLVGVWIASRGYTLILAGSVVAGQAYLGVTLLSGLQVQVRPWLAHTRRACLRGGVATVLTTHAPTCRS